MRNRGRQSQSVPFPLENLQQIVGEIFLPGKIENKISVE